MEILKLEEEYFVPLFLYWKRLAETVPYFFSVPPEKWRQCLLEDKLGDDIMFLFQEIWIAMERGKILGFCPYGQPAFAWDKDGQKYDHPQIGLLRHFYFDKDRMDAANLLFQQSETYLRQFPTHHAFYHNFGMSCNAYHGRLHQSLAHVDGFLREKGYQLEPENVYYSLDLTESELIHEPELELIPIGNPEPDMQQFEICRSNEPIGVIQLRALDHLTGDCTTDIAYLLWIEISSALRHHGWGTQTMQLLVTQLYSQHYRHLHLDTTSTNQIGQQFYERLGFANRGWTRCYIKTNDY